MSSRNGRMDSQRRSGALRAPVDGRGGNGRGEDRGAGEGDAAAQLRARVQERLGQAQAALEALLAVQGPRTVESTLTLYDEILLHADAAGLGPALLERVHPDPAVRQAAEEATREVDKFTTALLLNRGVYEALDRIDVGGADAVTQHYLTRTLRDYRRAGVDRDEATRQRVQELREELTRIGQEFERNIQSDTRSIRLEPEALGGLPRDYVQAHGADAEGVVSITTDYPDYVPFMTYAHSEEARRKLFMEFRRRGHPRNLEVLSRMLARRHELAQLLGYGSWAHYVTEDKMIRTEVAAHTFIERIASIATNRAERDYAQLLAARQKDDPQAKTVNDWEKEYYDRIVKAADYAFDPQEVRPYLGYERVKQGVLDLTARLFGIEYRRVQEAGLWSPDVETYEVLENGRKLGRFHLDMHPRPDKYKHAAQFSLVHGVEGKQLPEAVLVCNFSRPTANDPAFLEHDDVETFLHEFGHLLHTLFAGRQRWIGISGITTEWDFVEAPSQMLEEWARDAQVLRTFAVHHETGEKIPDELVERLRRANEFGKGAYVRQQMFYAALSLGLHDRSPEGLDTTEFVNQMQHRYSMYDYVDGTYFHLSFGHLEGYSALYYTYMWSLVIAKDLFSRFDRDDLMNVETAAHYRRSVLEAGGSAPAADLVQRFLGRPFGFESFQAWLDQD